MNFLKFEMLNFILLFFIILIKLPLVATKYYELRELKYFYMQESKTYETYLKTFVGLKIEKLIIELHYTHYVDKLLVNRTDSNGWNDRKKITTKLINWNYNSEACLNDDFLIICRNSGSLIVMEAEHFQINSLAVYGYNTYAEAFYGCFDIPQIKTNTFSERSIKKCLERCENSTWMAINLELGCVCLKDLSWAHQKQLEVCDTMCTDLVYNSCGGRNGEFSIYSTNQYEKEVIPLDKVCAIELKKERCPKCRLGRSGIRCNKIDCTVNNGRCESLCQSQEILLNNPAVVCACGEGYYLTNDYGCQDTDECNTKWFSCDEVSQTCHNTVGSFECRCKPGFKESKTLINNRTVCDDINECLNQYICDRNTTTCHNIRGDFECSCFLGYIRVNPLAVKGSCRDIDECSLVVNPCKTMNGVCKNIDGSYECFCGKGFKTTESKVCEDIDECMLGHCDLDSTICQNIPGDYRCVCRGGFVKLDSSQQSACFDLDECQLERCGKVECVNTLGSFYCLCPPGTKMQNYSHLIECEDIDECLTLNSCDFDKSVCINTRGYYGCICTGGYVNVDNITCVLESDENISTTVSPDYATNIMEAFSTTLPLAALIAPVVMIVGGVVFILVNKFGREVVRISGVSSYSQEE